MSNNHVIQTAVLELMASRVCHDLISPVGAINNGVEFLEEMGPEAGQDAIDLIAHSAKVASARLQCFRIAYGMGGRDPSIKPWDVKDVFDNLVTLEQKVTQDWDARGALGFDEYPEGFAKVLMGTLMLASECLPKGGVIRAEAGEALGITTIIAEGENAAPRSNFVEALHLELSPYEVEPVLVHPYVLGLLAKHYILEASFGKIEPQRVSINIKAL